MKSTYETNSAGAKSVPEVNRNPHLSSDGKWSSFPKVPNLLQCVIAGTYYARCKVNGKPVRARKRTCFQSPSKDFPTGSKSFANQKQKSARSQATGSNHEAETKNGYTSRRNRFVKLAPSSVAYRLRCLECLRRTLVEAVFHPNKIWKELNEDDRKDGLAKLDGMKASAGFMVRRGF